MLYEVITDAVEAERWVRRSIELSPNAFSANTAMVLLQLQLGNEAEAVEPARKAIAIRMGRAQILQPELHSAKFKP